MNIFHAIYQTYSSVTSTIVSTARSIEKTALLIENELDIINQEQAVHITETRAELATIIDQKQLLKDL